MINSKRKPYVICFLLLVCLFFIGSIVFIRNEHKANEDRQEDVKYEEKTESQDAIEEKFELQDNKNEEEQCLEDERQADNESKYQHSQKISEKQYIQDLNIYEAEVGDASYYRIRLGNYDVDFICYYYSGYDLYIWYDAHSHHVDFQVLNSDMVEIPINVATINENVSIYHFTCYNEECVLRLISEDGTDVEDIWIMTSVDPISLDTDNVLGYTEWTYEIHEGPLSVLGENCVHIYSVPDHEFLGGVDYAADESFEPEKMELFVVDIDDDGVNELISNYQHTSGGRCVKIYKKGYRNGLVDWTYYERSLGVDWLMPSVIQEYYDPERNLIIGYLSNELWESKDPNKNLLSSDARIEYVEDGVNFLIEIDDPNLILYYEYSQEEE